MNNKELVKTRILLCNLNLASYMNEYYKYNKDERNSDICKASLYVNMLILYDMGYIVYESDEEYYFIDYPESDFDYPKYRIKKKDD